MWGRESDLLDHMRLPCESLYAERAGYKGKEIVRYDCLAERTFTNGQQIDRFHLKIPIRTLRGRYRESNLLFLFCALRPETYALPSVQ